MRALQKNHYCLTLLYVLYEYSKIFILWQMRQPAFDKHYVLANMKIQEYLLPGLKNYLSAVIAAKPQNYYAQPKPGTNQRIAE